MQCIWHGCCWKHSMRMSVAVRMFETRPVARLCRVSGLTLFGEVSAERAAIMKIRAGYAISYDCPQPTPMILALSVHPSRRGDLITFDQIRLEPQVPATEYTDRYGNICHVIRAPAGRITLSADFRFSIAGGPTRSLPAQRRARSRRSPSRRWSICSAAATARPTGYPVSPGRPSAAFHRVGVWCRPSSISCTTTLPSAIRMPT